jgi:4-amino-4-deoxy-L-arabinose transferase-like glycosyltransferase
MLSSSFEHFVDRNEERLYAIALVAVASARFLNLGFLDLQAWDEALYAIRSVGILQFGGIFDQTSFSVGGLYSALHPPLYVWLSSVSFLIFGVTEFAIRFFSALFGGLTLMIIYKMGKELHSPKAGFIAAMLFGLNPFVSFFARQGQFDTTLVFFLSLSTLYLLRYEARGGLHHAALGGVAIGAALMTKLFVGFGIPLTYFFWKAATHEDKDPFWKPLLVSVGMAILVSAPWYVYMTIVRGNGNPLFFLDASAVIQRSVAGVEGNVKPLEVFYYVNQLFVLFPLGIIWFIVGMYRIFQKREKAWLLLALWFVVYFVVFTLMRTKLAVYLLPMLVPASLIAAYALVAVVNGLLSKKLSAVCLGATGIAFVWASRQTWRSETKSLFTQLLRMHLPTQGELVAYLPFLIIVSCIVFIAFALYRREDFSRLNVFTPSIVLLPAFVACFYTILAVDQFEYRDGAHDLAEFIAERQPTTLVVVGFDRNPQLTFYLDGADIGWRDDIEVTRLKPPTDRSQLRGWLSQQMRDLATDVLVVVEKDKFIRYEWVTTEELLPPEFSVVFESRRYAVFQRTPSAELAQIATQPTR